MIAATDQPATRLCCACFDGSYPIELPGETQLGKNVVEHMLATAARTGVPIQEPEGRRHPVQADNDNVSALRRPWGAAGSASRRRHPPRPRPGGERLHRPPGVPEHPAQ